METRQIAAATLRLGTGIRIRLSDLSPLEPTAFVLFLDLLGEALSCGVPGDERVEIVSIDGTFQIILEPTGDGSMAAIATSAGRFSGADHSVTIRDVDGRWQLDPLPGAWSKPAAAHIGEGAREAARRARLAALAVELAGAEEELARIDHDGAPIRRREQSARTEAGAAPGDERIRAALAAIVEAGRTADALRSRVGEAKTRVAVRRAALDAATSARDEAAQDPGLAAWVADLRGVEEASAGRSASSAGANEGSPATSTNELPAICRPPRASGRGPW